jgi:heme/copper-type cytochrome/quinol oxidase subunit 1
MAITETRPEPVVETPETRVNPWGAGEEYPPFTRALGSGDHKTLGRFYIVFSLLFGVGAWVLAALTTADDIVEWDLLSSTVAGQVFTLSRFALVFLFAIPLVVGIATYVVPLQVGASTVAFPRAAAAAFWGWLMGSLVLVAAYLANGGVGGRRTDAISLGYLALGVTIVALLLATVCVLTTIVTLRTPGMRLDRVPVFSWSMLVTGTLWLVTLPVLLANILVIYVDFHFGRPSDFGVGPNQWSQLSWAFQQLQVFVIAIPVLGIVSDIVATMAGVRVRNRGFLLGAVAAFGILTFGAYAQPFFHPEVWTEWLYVGQSIVLLLPLLMLIGGWATTLRVARPRLLTAPIGAFGSVLLLLVAAVAAILYVIEPLRLQVGSHPASTPFFQFGVLVLVVGAVTVAGIAGLHYWGPKIWGRLPHDTMGKVAALLGVVGSLIGGLALCINGFQARFDALVDAGDALNGIAAAGIALVVIAVAVAAASLVSRGPEATDDPWGGQTLEWTTTSPPAPGNFGEVAVVSSPEPVLDLAAEPVDEPEEVDA